MIPDSILDRARALHESSLVTDLHADTFLAVRYKGSDIARRHARPIGWAPFMLHCDLPRWREGGVRAQGLGIVATKLMTRSPREHARATIALMHETFRKNAGEVELVRDPDELEAAAGRGKLAAFLGLEGAHMYEGDLETVRELHEKGVRYVTLAHFFSNDVVSSSSEKHASVKLTGFGRDVVRELNRLGALVDLAHVHEESFHAALDASESPAIVSHGGCRALRDHHRNLSDSQLHALAARGGVVGVIFFPWYLSRNPLVSLERIVDHMEHIARTVGARHVALGSDWDGFVWMPRGLPDAAALPRLTVELVRRGFSDDEIHGILGGNFLRAWRSAIAVSDAGKVSSRQGASRNTSSEESHRRGAESAEASPRT
ncbi:membrane dipeptidase [bacterium]|nr:membrane dipeptidase [bacterium]